MGLEWRGPEWREQGRTGPGPAAPKYARGKDRRAVRRGKKGNEPAPKKKAGKVEQAPPANAEGGGSNKGKGLSCLVWAVAMTVVPVGAVAYGMVEVLG